MMPDVQTLASHMQAADAFLSLFVAGTLLMYAIGAAVYYVKSRKDNK